MKQFIKNLSCAVEWYPREQAGKTTLAQKSPRLRRVCMCCRGGFIHAHWDVLQHTAPDPGQLKSHEWCLRWFDSPSNLGWVISWTISFRVPTGTTPWCWKGPTWQRVDPPRACCQFKDITGHSSGVRCCMGVVSFPSRGMTASSSRLTSRHYPCA